MLGTKKGRHRTPLDTDSKVNPSLLTSFKSFTGDLHIKFPFLASNPSHLTSTQLNSTQLNITYSYLAMGATGSLGNLMVCLVIARLVTNGWLLLVGYWPVCFSSNDLDLGECSFWLVFVQKHTFCFSSNNLALGGFSVWLSLVNEKHTFPLRIRPKTWYPTQTLVSDPNYIYIYIYIHYVALFERPVSATEQTLSSVREG